MNVIRSEKLRVGMKLGENIYRDDQLVITSGVALTSRHIEMIKRLDIPEVKILEKKKLSFSNNIKYEEKYKEAVDSFKDICYGVTIGSLVLYDEVQECIEPLIQELEANPEMALRLWQMHTADFYTYEHSVKVSMLAVLLSKWLGKPKVYQEEIARVGLLHDIGKCNIPNDILNKPDVLTQEEFSVMKTHSTLGYVLLNSTKNLSKDVVKGVLHHHERYDGRGYPSKLSGENIPEYARIVSVVDIFDAMTSKRVYREKMNPFRVMEIMKNGSQGAIDPYIGTIFLDNLKSSYLGEKVLLSSGHIGTVHEIRTQMPERPVIRVEDNLIDLDKELHIEIKEMIL
ncbi:HD-GYP domain-containing protein [Acidaminobacter sp. JC074]|uniref:HD-GYP domain-containing protein n=1 Tax=Acidaminobacter sp. JC074 TaxID=2530199 RepID=UPI001F0F9145|nr:HD-GYP domain-containing protein [Acidaminobacter sp. JC074]MCH4889501.1 HD-GYP domain-containing protein [Acidaminobacter sp. JC074]